jgi:hypothetical protein
MRNLYNCPYCNQQSTRRWNLEIHIKRRHGGLEQPIAKLPHAPLQSPGKLVSNNWHTNVYDKPMSSNNNSSGLYLPSHPSLYSKQIQPQVNRNYQNRVVTDTPLSPETLQQRYPLPNASSYSTPTVQQKLEELRLLLGKFSSPWDAQVILDLAKFNLSQGDKRFLDDRLEQFRMLESQSWRR